MPERSVLDLCESSCHYVSTENKERKAKRPAGNTWQGKVRLTMISNLYIYCRFIICHRDWRYELKHSYCNRQNNPSHTSYRLEKICPASFHETCHWLKFPLNGLWAQSRVSPVVGLLPLASGPACFGMAFPPFLVKQLYRCDSVISSFVRTGYTTRRWGWVLGRISYSITHHYPSYPLPLPNRQKKSW